MRKVIICLAAVLMLLCGCTDAPDNKLAPTAVNPPIGAPLIGEREGTPTPNGKPLPYLAEELYRLK